MQREFVINETKQKKERYILVSAAVGSFERAEASLDELALLVDTAGAEVIFKVIQSVESVHPATYVGKGKVAEISGLIDMYEADGIVSILLQEEKITAPELAERFEVSRRTINRDIEDLCKAGIPIRTAQGTGGGISIMDGYRMDRAAETDKGFTCRNAPMPDLSQEKVFPGGTKVKAFFTSDVKWRLESTS
ncbi:MAG: HTH domain-containing protein [Lachnospiraceae bacterium]|nr:HTH domain-containing protein [Lachnospiraceae bacterium]